MGFIAHNLPFYKTHIYTTYIDTHTHNRTLHQCRSTLYQCSGVGLHSEAKLSAQEGRKQLTVAEGRTMLRLILGDNVLLCQQVCVCISPGKHKISQRLTLILYIIGHTDI